MIEQQTATAVAEETLQLVVSSATDVGGREGNEDAMLVEPLPAFGIDSSPDGGGYLLAIADGMGGYQRGEVASKMAVDTVAQVFREDPGGDPVPLLKQAFRRANDEIFAGGQGAVPPQMMGTTLVVAVTKGKYATIASIGDSRAYLLRAGRINLLTRDHSLVAEQVAQGQITEDEARESPHRNILTHALGHKARLDSKMPNVFELTLLAGDRLFLCTDGFYDVVTENDLQEMLGSLSAEAVSQEMVSLAVQRGASDNVTAIVASAEAPRRDITQVLGPGAVQERSSLLPQLAIAAVLILAILTVLVLFVL